MATVKSEEIFIDWAPLHQFGELVQAPQHPLGSVNPLATRVELSEHAAIGAVH